jgi:hypothetical protein
MARQITIAEARAAAERDYRELLARFRESGISTAEKERIANALMEIREQIDLLDD